MNYLDEIPNDTLKLIASSFFYGLRFCEIGRADIAQKEFTNLIDMVEDYHYALPSEAIDEISFTCYLKLAKAFLDNDEFVSADKFLEDCLYLAEKEKNAKKLIKTYTTLIKNSLNKGNIEESKKYFLKGKRNIDSLKDWGLISDFYNQAKLIFSKENKINESISLSILAQKYKDKIIEREEKSKIRQLHYLVHSESNYNNYKIRKIIETIVTIFGFLILVSVFSVTTFKLYKSRKKSENELFELNNIFLETEELLKLNYLKQNIFLKNITHISSTKRNGWTKLYIENEAAIEDKQTLASFQNQFPTILLRINKFILVNITHIENLCDNNKNIRLRNTDTLLEISRKYRKSKELTNSIRNFLELKSKETKT